jgi:putative ABC transport system permease protein
VCRRIEHQTGLLAVTRDEFFWNTIGYYLRRTGIPINFGITVALGFLVGCAVAGQTFYLFTIENLKQYGVLKAMGLSNVRILRMVVLQALLVGFIGYGVGIGLAAASERMLGIFVTNVPPAFYLSWHLLVGAGVAVLLIVLMASLVSARRVLVVEPAIVFRS